MPARRERSTDRIDGAPVPLVLRTHNFALTSDLHAEVCRQKNRMWRFYPGVLGCEVVVARKTDRDNGDAYAAKAQLRLSDGRHHRFSARRDGATPQRALQTACDAAIGMLEANALAGFDANEIVRSRSAMTAGRFAAMADHAPAPEPAQ